VDLLAVVHPWKGLPQFHRAAVCQFEEPALSAPEAVAGPGVLLEKTGQSPGEIRQRRRISLPTLIEIVWCRRAKRRPRTSRHLALFITDRLPRFQQRCELVRRELPKALEVGTSRRCADADERHGLGGPV